MNKISNLLFVDKEDWIGPKIAKYLVDNPTVMVTVIYVTLSGLGLVYEYTLFSNFGVNIIEYSDPADFFLAALKRPEAYAIGGSAAVSIFVYKRMADWAKRLTMKPVKWIFLIVFWIGMLRREILIPVAAAYFLGFFVTFAVEQASRPLLHGEHFLEISTRFGPTENGKECMFPVGSTDSFLFGISCDAVLRHIQQEGALARGSFELSAVPFSNIIRIEYTRR